MKDMDSRAILAILTVVGVIIVSGLYADSLTGFFLKSPYQKTYTLDLDDYSFLYNTTAFNDSDRSKEFDFSETGPGVNRTFWVELPGNSTLINASLNMSGKITTIYTTLITENGLLEVRIDNVTGYPGNEVISGSGKPAPNIYVINGSNGNTLWNWNLESPNNDINSIVAGDISPDPGKEIAFTVDQLNKVVVITANSTGGSLAWEYITPTTSAAVGVDIADLEDDGDNELVFSDASGYVYALKDDGTQKWNISLGGPVNALHVNDITSHQGEEIAAGADKLYIINSTGSVIWSKDLGNSIEDLHTGNVTADPGNEIAVGTSSPDNKVYLLNTTDSGGEIKWYYQLSGYPMAVTIGDATTEPRGNEIVIGDNDQHAYALSHNGTKIWDYRSEEPIESTDVGELTDEPGVEVAAGGMQGSLYIFNFNFFPTNLSIDVGADGDYEWKYYQEYSESKLRSDQFVKDPDVTNAIQAYVDSCTPDMNGTCDVPLLFHSDFKGKLKLSGLNITYRYNVSGAITKEDVGNWSRTSDIRVNESVGNESIKINFNTNPANALDVRYIKLDPASDSCDFNGSSYQNTTVNGENVCDISDFNLDKSGDLPESVLFWESTMSSMVPVVMNSSNPWYTSEVDDYRWHRNLTIWSDVEETFHNVTANASLNDTEVKEGAFLKARCDGSFVDITPSSEDAGCDGETPSYVGKSCGDETFYVCKEDTHGTDAVDFFRWKQPHTSSKNYIVGGSTNFGPDLSGMNVTPNSSTWGSNFTFYVDVSDGDGNQVNVTLLVFANKTAGWEKAGTQSVSGSGTLGFDVSSTQDWAGMNRYRLEYFDHNTTHTFHTPTNTSIQTGPEGLRHNVSFVDLVGNDSTVHRGGTVTLGALVNDTVLNQTVGSGVNISIWVMLNGSTWDGGHSNTTNSTGHLRYLFSPDGNYTVGERSWKMGAHSDEYYKSDNLSLVTQVKGNLTVSLLRPSDGDVLYRNSSEVLRAVILDQYGRVVEVEGYNCTFEYDDQLVDNSSYTNTSGYCSYLWDTDCSLSRGAHRLNVTLWNGASDNYTIENAVDSSGIEIWDRLNLAVDSPTSGGIYHKNDTIGLGSTVNDTCVECSKGDYNVSWSLNHFQKMYINLTELSGIGRANEPYVLNGSYLEVMGIDTEGIDLDKIRLLSNGSTVPMEIRPWESASRKILNQSKEKMDNNTEILFLLDLDPNQKKKFTLSWNETRIEPIENISFLKNGGFEGGDLDGWTYDNRSHPGSVVYPYSTFVENKGYSGNYSAHLTADDDKVFLNQSLDKSVTGTLKMKYKAWGTYSNAGDYIRVGSPGNYCNLSLASDGITEGEAGWNETNCSLISADDISVVISDEGSGGYEEGASHILIDYICLANSTGHCSSLQSGAPVASSADVREKIVNDTHDGSWEVSSHREVGERRLLAEAYGSNYSSDSVLRDFLLYGWSNLSKINITSDSCIYNGTDWTCRMGALISLGCWVEDLHTSEPVDDHSVGFYNDSSLMGHNDTDGLGVGHYNFGGPNTTSGRYNLTCNITDDGSAFYNDTEQNERSMSYFVSSGNTTGTLLRSPASVNATDITRLNNYTFSILVTLLNTGDGSMYDTEINVSTPSGIYAPEVECPSISIGENCTRNITINVTQTADLGENLINITGGWRNGDSTSDNATNSTSVDVKNNTELNIVETEVRREVQSGFDGTISNFTLESFGNTELEGITLAMWGEDSSQIGAWTDMDLGNTSIEKAGNRTVDINATIPIDVSAGNYLANITANATNSSCSPGSQCWDTALLNISVTEPDWYVSTDNITRSIGSGEGNGTVGSVEITNNLDMNQSFALSISGNGTQYMHLSDNTTEVANGSSVTVHVFHNRTDSIYQAGTYLSNVTITSLNGSIPHELVTEVTLNIINLTVTVLEPTSLDDAGPLNASENITVRVNVTKPGRIITSNLTFDAFVGGEDCSIVDGPEWHDPDEYEESYEGWYMVCRAPEIPGNPINNTLRVRASQDGISSYGSRDNSVVYYDVTPPSFSEVRVEPVMQGSGQGAIPIEVDITDNTAVDTVWMNITRHGSDSRWELGSENYTNTSAGLYTFNFSNPDVVGDYDITVYANDTGGINGYSGHLGNKTGWFDIYEPVDVVGNMTTPGGDPIDANFTFYRDWSGRNIVIHSFETNSSYSRFNWTAHKRTYDVEADMFGHTVKFESLDTNSSAINQFGSGAGRVSNPFRFDSFPNTSYSQIHMTPDYFEDPVLGFVIEANENLSFSQAEITLDYSESVQPVIGSIPDLNDLVVMKCNDWSYENRSCNTDFPSKISDLTDEYYVDKDSLQNDRSTLKFTTVPSTGYIVAEGCYDENDDLIHCAGLREDGDQTTGGGTSGGGAAPEEEEPFPFELETNLETSRLFPGGGESYWVMITNKLDRELAVNISTLGVLDRWMGIEEEDVVLDPMSSKTLTVEINTPDDADTGTYLDALIFNASGKEKTIPVKVVVKERGEDVLSLDLEIIDMQLYREDDLQAKVSMESLGDREEFDVNLTYLVIGPDNRTAIEINESVSFSGAYSDIIKIPLEGENLKAGKHKLEVWAEFGDKAVNDMATFQIIQHFWASTAGQVLIFLGVPIALIAIAIGAIQIKKYYSSWREAKEEEKRYLFPVDYSKIPGEKESNFWIGKIADRNKKAWYNSKDLMTHLLVAGATGSGKSVGASVFAEEALEKNIPVVVFDPTAQWTGFVKSCKDEYMLKYYDVLGMDKNKRKSYPGMIYDMSEERLTEFYRKEIDFKKFTNPGEITVFTLNELTTNEFDQAVRSIIDLIFTEDWEESEDLKLVVVFDEVHRLLEKYGGKGGYTALERACREFRKWGIGIIMCSQVLADFKEAVAGNVLTDVQLNTKSLTDINKAKTKYGEKYAKRITRQGIGVGMMQHPQYNEGDPWFVRFRPTWHNPHKLKEEMLDKYKQFAEDLEEIEGEVKKMKEKGEDTFDLETSLRMAKKKLKSGNFRMAEIYINSLKEKLELGG